MTCLTLHELQSITFVYFWRIEWIQPISISWIFVRNYSLLFNSSEVPTRPFRPLMIFFYSFHGSVYLGGLDKLKQTTWVMQSSGQIIHRQNIAPADRMMYFCWRVEKCYGWRSYRSYRFSWVVSKRGKGVGEDVCHINPKTNAIYREKKKFPIIIYIYLILKLVLIKIYMDVHECRLLWQWLYMYNFLPLDPG